jgi:uncharacterized protein YcsI (UPF0317 family)
MLGRIRRGEWTGPTVGCCDGYVQANLVVLPRRLAGDFLLFCERNPGPCPLLEATAPGEFEPRDTAPGADLRTDLPRYRIYRNGGLEEQVDISCECGTTISSAFSSAAVSRSTIFSREPFEIPDGSDAMATA